jgi:hypothetical protein
MADDPKRLGKRGAYRLGELRAPGPPPPRPRVPREPSFGSRRSRRSRRTRGWLLAWLAGWAVTAALLGLAAGLGWWFLPFAAGVAAGAGPWRARPALGLVVLAVLAGWGAALWWPALSGAPAGATARTVAALAGLPPYAGVGVAGTLLTGVAQALVAFWLARALTAWTR